MVNVNGLSRRRWCEILYNLNVISCSSNISSVFSGRIDIIAISRIRTFCITNVIACIFPSIETI